MDLRTSILTALDLVEKGLNRTAVLELLAPVKAPRKAAKRLAKTPPKSPPSRGRGKALGPMIMDALASGPKSKDELIKAIDGKAKCILAAIVRHVKAGKIIE